MGLSFQMVNAGSLPGMKAAALAGGPATASEAGLAGLLGMLGGTNTAESQPFAELLVKNMGGPGSQEQAGDAQPQGALLALLQRMLESGMAAPGKEAEGESAEQLAALVDQLDSDMQKMDELAAQDPELLAALQNWLLQASALLKSTEAGEGTQGAEGELPPLANSADTIRFAVQDTLNQLSAHIQKAAAEGEAVKGAEGLALLNAFAEMAEKPLGKPAAAQNASPAAQRSADFELSGPPAQERSSVLLRGIRESGGQMQGQQQGQLSQDTSQSQAFKGALNTAAAETAATEMTEAEGTPKTDEIITAGQLALREGISHAHKTENAKVPVHGFAKEVTGLIAGKLEIIQKTGSVEAVIKLFPDNLGQVDVRITMQNGHLVAQFITEHAGTKDLLEQQMSQLRSSLTAQGLQVDKLEVAQSSSTGLQSQMFHDGRQPNSGGQQDRRSRQRNEASDDALVAAELSGELQEWMGREGAGSSRNFGRSFTAEA